LNSRFGCAQVEQESIGAFRNLNDDGIVRSLVRIVLGKFHPQASSLDAHRGVALGIESDRTPKNLGSDLVLLQGDARVIQRMFGKVPKELTEGFGCVEAMAFNKFIYLLEALLPTDRETVRDSHITGK